MVTVERLASPPGISGLMHLCRFCDKRSGARRSPRFVSGHRFSDAISS